jgi:hypothetical protein
MMEFFVVVALILMLYAVIDLVGVVDREQRAWTAVDLLWLIVIGLLVIVGPLVWLISGKRARHHEPTSRGP